MVVFAEVAGRAEAWVDGVKRAEKTDFAPAPLEVPFPAGAGERQVVLVVEAEPGKASGLGGRFRCGRGKLAFDFGAKRRSLSEPFAWLASQAKLRLNGWGDQTNLRHAERSRSAPTCASPSNNPLRSSAQPNAQQISV